MSMHDVYLLANLLRSTGDRVLNGESKLRLTPSLLHKLNTCFSQIATQDTGPDFHVIPAHGSQLTQLSELDFLHDFVQKTPGLTISGLTVDDGSPKGRLTPQQRRFSRNSKDGSVLDLTRFRQLHHLEVRGGTIESVAGVSALRGHIRTLMLIRMGETDFSGDDLLRTVLAGCMHTSTDAHKDAWWPSLTQLVACYCRLESLGPCLSLAPRLVVLDLSHNALVNESALSSQLGVLLNLRYLNLSYNRLTCIPELRPELQYLVISHNHISYIDNVENLTGLQELNLAMNHLSNHSQLREIRKMPALHRLYLAGNPLFFHSEHRLRTCANLPRHSAQVKFLLDGTPFSKREKEAVLSRKEEYIPASTYVTASVPTSANSSLLDSQQSLTQSFSQQGSSGQRRNKRENNPLITSVEDIVTAPVPTSAGPSSLLDSQRSLNQSFSQQGSSGQRRNRRVNNVVITSVEDMETMKPPEKPIERSPAKSSLPPRFETSTPKDLSPIISYAAQMMEERLRKMEPVKPAPPPPIMAHTIAPSKLTFKQNLSPPSNATTPLNLTTDSSIYVTADESTSTVLVSSSDSPEPSEQTSDTMTRSESIGTSEEEPEADSDDEDAELRTYVGQLVNEGSSDQEVFITISSRRIKELETDTLQVRERWLLGAVSECDSTEGNRLTLSFKSGNSSKLDKRIYIMEDKAAVKEVVGRLRNIIEARDVLGLNAMRAMHCMECSSDFSQEIVQGNSWTSSAIPEDPLKAINRCPNCNSNILVPSEEGKLAEPLAPKERKISKTKPPDGNSLEHSTSDSSIGSAISLGSCSDPLALTGSDSVCQPNTSVRRCESDIDIISNPSQSSIEVLDDSNRSTPGRKRSSEERQVVAVPSLLPVPESNPPLAGLTESSSSGSMTDSVCTAYENGVAATTNRRPASGSNVLANNVLQEEPSRESSPMSNKEQESDPFNTMLNNLLKSVGNDVPAGHKTAKSDLLEEKIHYDYDNLAAVDHRLKLHLYLSLLEEMDELLFVLRSEIFVRNNSSHYDGFLVVSSNKVYLLKITGPENKDRIDSWLTRTSAIDRSKIRFMTPLPWMAGVHIQSNDDTDVILFLRDDDRTRNLLKFSKDAGLPVEDDTREDNAVAASVAINTVYDKVEGEIQHDMHHIETSVYLCSTAIIGKDGEKRNEWEGGALHVGLDWIVLTDDSVWCLIKSTNDRPPEPLKCRHTQPTSNLMKVVTNRCRLSLEFFDEAMGQQETWQLHAKTENVLTNVIYSLRLVWEPMFSIPLQVIEELEKDDR